jgi:hypothetical protein
VLEAGYGVLAVEQSEEWLTGRRYLDMDVCFSDGSQRMFWPEDLEEAPSSSRSSWWRSVLGEA